MSNKGHWSSHGNLRAGNKFYMEAAERGHLAKFDPANKTYTVFNTVLHILYGIHYNAFKRRLKYSEESCPPDERNGAHIRRAWIYAISNTETWALSNTLTT